MTGFYSPNLKLLKTWQSTFAQAFQTLTRVNFATDDTFTYSDFSPTLTWPTPPTKPLYINVCRGSLKNKDFKFYMLLQIDLLGATNQNFTVSIPYTAYGLPFVSAGVLGPRQGGVGWFEQQGLTPGGLSWQIQSGTNLLLVQKLDQTNFGTKASNFYISGSVEVI